MVDRNTNVTPAKIPTAIAPIEDDRPLMAPTHVRGLNGGPHTLADFSQVTIYD